MKFTKQLENYFRACFPAIALKTTEEQRAIKDIVAAAQKAERAIVNWSCYSGYEQISGQQVPKKYDDCKALFTALQRKNWEKFESSVIIFRDIHNWPIDRDPNLARGLKELMLWGPNHGTTIIFLGQKFVSNDTFREMVTVVEYDLPGKESLKEICKNILESSKSRKKVTPELIDALSGLTHAEAENALALSIVEANEFDPQIIYREKVQAVRRNGYLELIESNPKGLDSIGGLDELKKYILKRRAAYTKKAMDYGLHWPKGLLLVGVPGSGKGLASKAIGTALGIPTLKLDVGMLFDKHIGESEARTRQVLALAEAMAPCCLWIDEIDKGLAGAGGSGGGDSGVTKRVFGSIISWMQDKKRPVYVIATANQVEGLPPELLRKGRFDEIFAVDLPNKKERTEIFKIHLERIKRPALIEGRTSLIKSTEGFTGAEIETVIDSAMFNAFDEDREINVADITKAARETQPLSVTAKEKVDAIRDWAKERARMASEPDEKKPTPSRKIG